MLFCMFAIVWLVCPQPSQQTIKANVLRWHGWMDQGAGHENDTNDGRVWREGVVAGVGSLDVAAMTDSSDLVQIDEEDGFPRATPDLAEVSKDLNTRLSIV